MSQIRDCAALIAIGLGAVFPLYPLVTLPEVCKMSLGVCLSSSYPQDSQQCVCCAPFPLLWLPAGRLPSLKGYSFRCVKPQISKFCPLCCSPLRSHRTPHQGYSVQGPAGLSVPASWGGLHCRARALEGRSAQRV